MSGQQRQGKKGKRQRAHKVSRGIHGATHHPLSGVEKVLLGKGQLMTIRHVECLRSWSGSFAVGEKFDARAASENLRLYPHLFLDD